MLGPLVVDEILIRLLRTAIGPRSRRSASPSPELQRMADAVAWIRAHFAQPVTVDEMAAAVHMSASTFHERFKAVTSMSPLQYQKVLRLHEARRLMLFQNMDAGQACQRVGYLSSSQFSREYCALLRKRAHQGYRSSARAGVRSQGQRRLTQNTGRGDMRPNGPGGVRSASRMMNTWLLASAAGVAMARPCRHGRTRRSRLRPS